MKKLILIALLINASLATAMVTPDTTIIEFSDKVSKNRVKVISNNNKTFEIPKVLNLDNVLKAIGVDSTERERAFVMVTNGGKNRDTILVISREGQRIKIVTKDDNSFKRDTLIKRDSQQEKIESFKDNNDKDDGNDKKRFSIGKIDKKFFSRSDFGIYIGLNNFINSSPSFPNQEYKLRTFQSRFVALSLRKNATLIKGKKVDVAFSYGPEIAWYNLMLQNSNLTTFFRDQVVFSKNSSPTEKSKLVVPVINLPVMLYFGFKEDKFKIGFGGYMGYRIGGYTKEKFVSGGKSKTKGDYGLTDIPYGLTTEFGKKNGLTLFARYDLNTMFNANQYNANELQAFSVGFRL